MRTLLIIATLTMSFTASASYSLSIKEIGIVKKDMKTSFENATVQYAGKRTVVITLGKKSCEIKNVRFEKYDGIKAIDEKTYNKVETCLE